MFYFFCLVFYFILFFILFYFMFCFVFCFCRIFNSSTVFAANETLKMEQQCSTTESYQSYMQHQMASPSHTESSYCGNNDATALYGGQGYAASSTSSQQSYCFDNLSVSSPGSIPDSGLDHMSCGSEGLFAQQISFNWWTLSHENIQLVDLIPWKHSIGEPYPMKTFNWWTLSNKNLHF